MVPGLDHADERRVPGVTALLTQSDAIVVKRVRGKGRGVFALLDRSAGKVIESGPVLVIPAEGIRRGTTSTRLGVCCFESGRSTVALALGYGSPCNRSV